MLKPTHTSNDLFTAIKEYALSIAYEPSIEIQIFLTVSAIVLAFPASMLIRRIAQRRLDRSIKENRKSGLIISSLLSSVLLPMMVIINLIAAAWILPFLIPAAQNHSIIPNVTRIAMVWLFSSALLLAAQKHFIAYLLSIVMLVMTLLNVTGLLLPTQASLREISLDTEKLHINLLDIIKGIFTLIILFWGAGVMSQNGERWLRRSHLSFNARELSIKFLRLTLYFLAFIFTLVEMGVDLTALTVFGGALAVGLGFGLQKITSNFLSGIVLLFEKAIEAGDLIEVGNEKGWVRQMAIRHTLIETFDGREVLIPNEDLIIGKVTNWTYTNTRARIDINMVITFGSDVDLARKLLIEAAKSHKFCISEPPPAAHLKDFVDRGIQIMLVFWIPDVTQGLVSIKSEVMFKVIESFRAAGIRFAELT